MPVVARTSAARGAERSGPSTTSETATPPTGPRPTYLPDGVAAALRMLAVPASVVAEPWARAGSDADATTDGDTGTGTEAGTDAVPGAEVVPWEYSDVAIAVYAAVYADRRVDEDETGAWVEAELQVLEAVEKVKAWADFQGLAALRRMREAVYERVRAQNDDMEHTLRRPMMPSHEVAAEAAIATVDEAALATGLPVWQLARRLELATDEDGRGALVLAALARGDVTLDRAVRIHQDTQSLGTEVALAVSRRLLAPGRDGHLRSHAAFLRELRRQVVVHTPDPAQARADAVAERDATAVVDPDGVGTASLIVTGEAGRVCAAVDRVDDLARRLRAAGDPRTLRQLRSDVALDLLLYGWVTPGAEGANPSNAPTTAAPNARTNAAANASPNAAANASPNAPTNPATNAAGSPAEATAPEQSGATFVGQPPPAHVTVIVSLSTLLGLDQDVAEVVGHGFVSAVQARELAMAHGSVWRRLVVDPVTGAALDLSSHRYRPTKAMADMVAALDGMCRGPGCTIPAHRCDIDHDIPWPVGPTRIGNLSDKHRRHHNHKTRGTWTATTDPDGAITWRTTARRRYVSHRQNYLDPMAKPVAEVDIDRALADDPPPF